MKFHRPRVVIAGLRGGSGKTTLSIGLARALYDKGIAVSTFKKGPDYIDAGWLSKASGSPCHNLDPFLIPEDIVIKSFLYHSGNAQISLIEGNRGIFDGVNIEGTYSTAELAKTLKSPVVIIVDCTKVTRTVAAIIKGIQSFDNKLYVAGVILNNIAGQRHESIVRGTIQEYTDIKVIGAIKRIKEEFMPERHLGLLPHIEHPDVDNVINSLSRIVKESVDIGHLIDLTGKADDIFCEDPVDPYSGYQDTEGDHVRIGVIKDRAFQFYYPENIVSLIRAGAEIVEVDAMKEKALPALDALYIGGGFPETNAIELSKNIEFMESLKKAVEEGLPVYAECGGLMYLGRALYYRGKVFQMSNVLPVDFEIKHFPAAHGYTVVEVDQDNPYYPAGTCLKGHEFHYSRVIGRPDRGLKLVFRMTRGKGIIDGRDAIVYKNVLATYTHLHALGSPQWVEAMIKIARQYRKNR
ncbi:MAG: hydrogenobyrinic acid a,c-diamide synthase (glutamine-hydrolyzing) [Nitrospirae bacterium]|nr:hydrogenobyrinic acid a,c-diamide synthase (glutamine-hydrolyzing) [Nitrospirota bacterium]